MLPEIVDLRLVEISFHGSPSFSLQSMRTRKKSAGFTEKSPLPFDR